MSLASFTALTRGRGPFSFPPMSRLPFELLLALRYLRPKRTFVSVITLISVLGVTLGVAVLIIVISVMSGFDQQLRQKILGFSPHLRVIEPNRTMSDWAAVRRDISSNTPVAASAPYVLGQVLLETQPQHGQSQVGAPWIRGIDPKLDPQVSELSSNLVDGKFDLSGRGLLVGVEFARNMGLAVGDRVDIYSPAELKKMRENQGKEGQTIIAPDEYEVRGIFDVGYFEYNASFVVASLQDAQDLYVLDKSVHGLTVTLKDPYKAPAVQRELSRRLGPGFQITTWMQENGNLLGALIVEKNVMFYLLFFIMIVAALCILSA